MVLGTAHVSARSVDDVRRFFSKLKPDAVCVELCQPRHEAMRDPDRWRKLDMTRIVKEKKVGLLASSLILSSFQKKIGENTGVKPGMEMLAACELAELAGKKLIFADREIRITLGRAWGRLGFFSKMWLGSTLAASLLVREDIDEESIEKMKQEDVLSDLFANLPRRYQHVKEVIIDERDTYLAQKIKNTARDLNLDGKAHKILAVVGAGHLSGIERHLTENRETDLEHLHILPPKRIWRTVFTWLSFSAVIGFFLFYLKEGGDAVKAFGVYAVCRSAGAGIGALIARANIFSFLATVVMAPISPVIVGSRLWMYPALTELWRNKPRVEDFENIADDTQTLPGFFKSLYRNRVMHLFWIIFMVSTGLTVGNLILVKFAYDWASRGFK